jgi:ParB/RepB/Spo0J family partition protein
VRIARALVCRRICRCGERQHTLTVDDSGIPKIGHSLTILKGMSAMNRSRSKALHATPSTVRVALAEQDAVRKIDIDAIDIEPQIRTVFEGIDEFAARINTEGLLQPIIVSLQENGRYLLAAGERRLRAVKLLGWTQIDAVVRRDLSRESFLTIQYSENEHRKEVDPCDRTLGIFKVIRELGREKARSVVGDKSKAWISKYAAIEAFPEKTRALLTQRCCGDIEILHVIATMEKEVAALQSRHAPMDDHTLASWEQCMASAKQGTLTRVQAREHWMQLQHRVKWAADSAQRRIEQTARDDQEAARTAAIAAAEKNAASDPKQAAKLAQLKAERKVARANQAQDNREGQYKYRLQQSMSSGQANATLVKRTVEEIAKHEDEQRILFVQYQAVRNLIEPVLLMLAPKQRASCLRGMVRDIKTAAKPQFSVVTKPPRGWVLP